jgi:hypothetical protein
MGRQDEDAVHESILRPTIGTCEWEGGVTSEFEILERRVARIESQNRRLRWLAVAFALALAALALVTTAYAQAAKELVIRAQKFELHDDTGHSRAELLMLIGEPTLRFLGDDGVAQAILTNDSFTIFQKGGGILASFAKDGLRFEDGHEKTFVMLTAHEKDQMGKLRLNDYHTGTHVVITAQDLAKLKSKSQ